MSLSLDHVRANAKTRSAPVRLQVSQRLLLGQRTVMSSVDLGGGGKRGVFATVR